MGELAVDEIFFEKKDEATLISFLDSPKLLQASTKTSRLVNKLKDAVANQALYETHQILRTVYFRFINNSEKIDALIDLLYYGAIHQLKSHEIVSGQDIATLFLEAAAKKLQSRLDNATPPTTYLDATPNDQVRYHRDNETDDLDICRKLSSIAVLLPDTEIGQVKFISDALRLLTPKILCRDLLHEVLGTKFYAHRDYPNARYHFLHSACVYGQIISLLLAEFHQERGVPSEVDLFITQFVLQYLCIQHPTDSPQVQGHPRHISSNATPSTLTVSKKSRKEIFKAVRYIFFEYINCNTTPALNTINTPYNLPLLNFVYLLLDLLDSNKPEGPAFEHLVSYYRLPLSRDPNYQCYLNRIGALYFGLNDPTKQQQQQQAGSGGGSFFNNILMSLLDATDDDDEDDAQAERLPTDLSSYDELD